MEYLKQLNQDQLEAATTTEGYVRVVAGAGSGKTKTLSARYLYLVEILGLRFCYISCINPHPCNVNKAFVFGFMEIRAYGISVIACFFR